MQVGEHLGDAPKHRRARAHEVFHEAVGSSIMRWTSSGTFATFFSERTTGTPIVMLGTKCPSMTSTWNQVGPTRFRRGNGLPEGGKSAARMDGAI